jgi:translation initiation factor IF-2
MKAKTEQQKERPPIVVVMGHVDHGKSTLLDFIRKSNTVAKEAGGITQHVAAYEVERDLPAQAGKAGAKKRITFIDTPGHAAFSAIRSRGANVANIAILVVAADDGVKAQTLEALSQIREAGIPFIVAINKIDKPNADLARTQGMLLEQGVYLEKFGGEVPWAAVSAKDGTGVDELLDLILLVAELGEYTADASAPAEGYVIEAHRDPKRGVAASLIITNGTLESGNAVLAGDAIAPVRIMESHLGANLKKASFSSPILLVGFDELPAVGERFSTYKNKREAETARAAARAAKPRTEATAAGEASGETYHMPVIVRADAAGSLEAILSEIAHIGDDFMRITVVQSGIGAVSEGDVKTALAGTKPATIIGFNVAAERVAEGLIRQHGVRLELFDIIYKLTERMEELLRENAPSRMVEEVLGRARVLRQFSSRKDEHVVGGSVLEGHIVRGGIVRVMRRNIILGTGKLKNIQANKQDADKIDTGSEFGAQIIAPFEVATGDILEYFVTKET